MNTHNEKICINVSRCITLYLAHGLQSDFFGVRYCFRSNYKYGSSGQNCTPRPARLYNCFDDSSTSRTAIAPASILLAFCGRGNRLIPIHLRDLKHATSRSD